MTEKMTEKELQAAIDLCCKKLVSLDRECEHLERQYTRPAGQLNAEVLAPLTKKFNDLENEYEFLRAKRDQMLRSRSGYRGAADCAGTGCSCALL